MAAAPCTVVITDKRSTSQRCGDDHQYEYESLVIITIDRYDFETFEDDFRVEGALVNGTGRLVRFGRVVDEQEAQAQRNQADADVQGKRGDEADFNVQVAGAQGAHGGRQRQDGRREPDPHGAAVLVGHVGQVREHADEETVERPGGRYDHRL